MNFRPMLAAACPHDQIDKLKYPLVATPKIDGVRAVWQEEALISRSGKPLPNYDLQCRIKLLTEIIGCQHFDGELVCGTISDTTSSVMSKSVDSTNLQYIVFDVIDLPNEGYAARLYDASRRVKEIQQSCGESWIKIVKHQIVSNPDELLVFEQDCLANGFEGVCLRQPDSLYKKGRSTFKEQGLLKLKRFEDAEGVVVGYQERYHNHNDGFVSELGYTKRSTCKGGKIPAGDLGSLTVQVSDGTTVDVGTGFTQSQREELWSVRETLIGKIVKFKHFPHGAKDAPRHPVFLCFRSTIDIGDFDAI